nr:MAG TPA: Protein of unknown function (DUF3920) [Caudoviricetes sp.]
MESLKILGQVHTIEVVDEISKSDLLNGMIDHDNQIIYIRKSLPPEKKKEVLLHEVIHGISEALDMDLKEKVVQMLARSLYDFLTTNQIISSWMVSAKEQTPQQS